MSPQEPSQDSLSEDGMIPAAQIFRMTFWIMRDQPLTLSQNTLGNGKEKAR